MEKKKLDKGQHTSLTRERKRHLESIGFRWAEPKGQEAWEKRYRELVEFKAKVCIAVERLVYNGIHIVHLSDCSTWHTRLVTVSFRPKVRRTQLLEDG